MKKTTITSANTFILRVLTGLLRGCEFMLHPGKTLFIVGPQDGTAFNAQGTNLSTDTLYLPVENGGNNFELLLTTEGQITLYELTNTGTAKQTVKLNDIVRLGELTFAIRSQESPWSQAVTDYPNIKTVANYTKMTPVKLKKPAMVAAAILALAGFGAFLNLIGNSLIHSAELSNLLNAQQQQFTILNAEDAGFYVVTNTEQETLWAQQALSRAKLNYPVKVINPRQENDRLGRWMANNYPNLAYYRFDLSEPTKPQLWLSQQRAQISDAERAQLLEKLSVQLPYAEKITLTSIDDESASRQAIAGLTSQALKFTRQDNDKNLTFVIEGALGDAELQRVRQFIEGYYQQWGNHYIQFAIKLKEDGLKGKSFQTGGEAYIKTTPSHWHFTYPQK